jgi:hypothetical protein
MKKILNRIKWFFVITFATIASFVSKVIWGGFSIDHTRYEADYWVYLNFENRLQEPSSLFFITKCIEFLLIWLVFILWIISFFKIRKIKDKELKSIKIKHTIFTIIILLLLMVLVRLWYRFYEMYF